MALWRGCSGMLHRLHRPRPYGPITTAVRRASGHGDRFIYIESVRARHQLKLGRMDSCRVKFLLRAYLRTRLTKVEQYILHTMMDSERFDEFLSPEERQFAEGYLVAMERHLQQSVLDQMPDKFQSMLEQVEHDEAEEEAGAAPPAMDMVTAPDLDSHVFCRILEDQDNFEINEDVMDLAKDDLYLMHYEPITELIAQNAVELPFELL
mmetsp:Transcript_3275/g.11795  ORF Transcript_3275/g.11795 Transcript_3275/m.11795 type:complete len:208 (+) Transcript_3275:1587-2210(+)